eukprot:4662696-Amphidinium_carterae.1
MPRSLLNHTVSNCPSASAAIRLWRLTIYRDVETPELFLLILVQRRVVRVVLNVSQSCMAP